MQENVNWKMYNTEQLNKTAEYSSKVLLTLNSGAFLAFLNFSDKSEDIQETVCLLSPLQLFALGLTFGLFLILSNYLMFLFSTSERLISYSWLFWVMNKISIIFGVGSGLSFLFGVWQIAI